MRSRPRRRLLSDGACLSAITRPSVPPRIACLLARAPTGQRWRAAHQAQ